MIHTKKKPQNNLEKEWAKLTQYHTWMTQCPKLRTSSTTYIQSWRQTTKYYSINVKTMDMKETNKQT